MTGKCRDCRHSEQFEMRLKNGEETMFMCLLTHCITEPDVEHECGCFNIDLEKYDICYNCRHYLGGGDWGMFCDVKDKYHHIGQFNDPPCECYDKRNGMKGC